MKRILFINLEEFLESSFKRWAEDMGYESVFCNQEGALEKLSSEYKLIIIGEADTASLIKKIRQDPKYKTIPILTFGNKNFSDFPYVKNIYESDEKFLKSALL